MKQRRTWNKEQLSFYSVGKPCTSTNRPSFYLFLAQAQTDLLFISFYLSHAYRDLGARGMSSVRYGTRLGDLKENWFLCFPIKHSTHTLPVSVVGHMRLETLEEGLRVVFLVRNF